MSTRKQDKATQNFKQIWLPCEANARKQYWWLLRGLIVMRRRSCPSNSGFVLPTTILLLLILSLVVAALLFRTSSRVNQVIAERQTKEIYNAASPAIDRAKAKLEFLFKKDAGLPNGVPGESALTQLMGSINDSRDTGYLLKGETRLDINNDGQADNAWSFKADTNGDGELDATIAYSIIGRIPTNQNDLFNQSVAAISNRAKNLLVRNGPVNSTQANTNCLQTGNNAGSAASESGWFIDSNNTAILRKNFQINAVVIPDKSTNRSVATLELQQDRQLERGNKWAAWFRYDLEVFNPPTFNWNGAMHTEGNFFVAANGNPFSAFLISSPRSCVFSRTASEISLTETTNEANQIQFQGQLVNGSLSDNAMRDNSFPFHFVDQNYQPVSSGADINISKATDSISDTSNVRPGDLALDPVALFTQDISLATNVPNPTAWNTIRDANWKNRKHFTNRRIFNQRQPKPYVDDTYRADDIYGPKPTYGKNSNLSIPLGKQIGEPIPKSLTELVSKNPIGNGTESVGLDGYWERRSRLEGLRVIVGQRLELGNPLLPATGANHLARQRRALRDNLAAVQATAIYHQANRNAGGDVQDFPIACLATTVHPGTAETLRRSATFQTINNATGNPIEELRSDFFTGRGTNGWEYEVPDPATFPNPEMLRALQNLANFAGDPFGAFPPMQDSASSQAVPAAGQRIHPLPELTSSGDFSNLRRALNNLAASSYAELSIADQSYLHTAACSLGMLANNIKALQDYEYNVANRAALSVLDGAIKSLPAFASLTPGDVITRLEEDTTQLLPIRLARARLARTIFLKEQVEYDRRNDPAVFSCAAIDFGSTNIVGGAAGAGLARLCPTGAVYSSLYYLFPTANHGEVDPVRTGNIYINNASVNPGSNSELYKTIASAPTSDAAALESIRLRRRRIVNGAGGGGSSPQLWVLPRADVSDSADPLNGGTYRTRATTPNDRQNNLIQWLDDTATVKTVYRVPFKDAALSNGREMMSTRVLDIDLDLLRRNTLPIDPATPDDNWLPQRGIIYAFREDAVREDGIARPAIAAWASCDTITELTSTACRTNANTPVDPPNNPANGIATKPVDFKPDPDRRPYGFRLRNGADLTRTSLALDHANNRMGLSFISDNPVYIQGNFNLHSTDGTANNLLEEFAEILNRDSSGRFTNFYTRTNRDTRFAQPSQDRWRPSEIIADAVTVISSSFCDGSIFDVFVTAGSMATTTTVPLAQYGCGNTDGVTSYLNQNRPSSTISPGYWLREHRSDMNTPVEISRNGNPRYCATAAIPCTSEREYNNGDGRAYYTLNDATTSDKKPLNNAVETRINSIIVSGSVPSRANQYNGGLHNFPRFIEDWQSATRLHISGALIQLNFSTYATAPWDHESWEPDGTPAVTTGEIFKYYRPPNRLWGYDVALQMSPAGPAARRFVSPSNTRSEFYRDLPIDDPYILNLRCAKPVGESTRIDPNANCSVIP